MALDIIKPHVITPEEAAQELLSRKKARQSLHEFTRQAWPQVEGGRDFKDNWHIGAKCEHLEAVTRGEIRNLLINEPPRATKSTLVNVMWPAWVWVEHPEMRWLFSSYAFTLSIRDSQRCRALILSDWYQIRYGSSFQILEDVNRLDRYHTDKGGVRLSTSVDSATLGEGGDIQVADDPNNTRDQSETMLQSTLDWWQNVMPTRVTDFKTVRRVVIQQRTHEKDLSGHIMANDSDGWVKLILPLEFEMNRRCVTVPLPSTKPKRWADPRTKEGELLDVQRIGPKELRQLKKDLGSEYAIAGQLQQRPAPASGGIIKRYWFKVWEQPEPPRVEYTLMSVDTALSEKKGAAYNAATTWGVFRDEHDIPNVILLSVWRERCEYPDLRSRMQRLARNYLDDGPTPLKNERKPDILLVEAKVSGISLIQDLARAGVLATKYDPTKLGDKIQRVRIVTPLLEAGRVWVPGRPPDYVRLRSYADLFVTQCISFPNAESRDLVDTMSAALWRLQSSGFVWHRDDAAPPQPSYRPQPHGALYG